MSPREKLIALSSGILGLLVVASLVGAILAARASTESARRTVANLNDRTRAWWWMVAVLGGALALGESATLVLFALASLFALREFLSLTPTRPGDYRALVLAFWIAIPAQYATIHLREVGVFAILIPVYAFLVLPSVTAFSGDTQDFLHRAAKLQWALMVCVYCLSHAPALLLLEIPGYEGPNALLLLYLLLVVQLSDVFQYVFGKLFGRTALAPTVSPSKTIEGLVGGGLAATLVGGSLWWITPFTFVQSLAMSAGIVAMGALGGLALSAVKRSLGAKDWGSMIEGHGGMLDRVDSVCFAAPVFFHLTRRFFT
ncbi:MAG: phosphatidate cytidylyltransferase [Planctomycetaceae bacterium]|nr:phosphatidate cytidylyltransferase [Planctomycetaceae bacterium]